MKDDAVNRKRGKFNSRGEPKLSAQVLQPAMWPTPSKSQMNLSEDLEHWEERRARVKATKKNGNGFGMPLTVAVRKYPTPTTPSGHNTGTMQEWGGAGSRSMLSDMEYAEISGTLNPPWVEWLMGFPLGWTDLDA